MLTDLFCLFACGLCAGCGNFLCSPGWKPSDGKRAEYLIVSEGHRVLSSCAPVKISVLCKQNELFSMFLAELYLRGLSEMIEQDDTSRAAEKWYLEGRTCGAKLEKEERL